MTVTSVFRAHRTRQLTALIVGVCLMNLLACTVYTPVRGTVDLATPTNVRVTLTDQGQLTVAPRIGLRAHRLEGSLQGMTDTSLSLLVHSVSREGGVEDGYLGEQLSLNSRDYQAVETSKTSVIRSLLLTGVLIASTFLLAQGIGEISGTGGSKPPPQTK
jgi:hypothetical protein